MSAAGGPCDADAEDNGTAVNGLLLGTVPAVEIFVGVGITNGGAGHYRLQSPKRSPEQAKGMSFGPSRRGAAEPASGGGRRASHHLRLAVGNQGVWPLNISLIQRKLSAE